MALLELVLVGSALALDAFAVSVASGVVIKERKVAHAIRVALFFGGFQAIMPLIGWLAGAAERVPGGHRPLDRVRVAHAHRRQDDM